MNGNPRDNCYFFYYYNFHGLVELLASFCQFQREREKIAISVRHMPVALPIDPYQLVTGGMPQMY
jgi:hypothetical protein